MNDPQAAMLLRTFREQQVMLCELRKQVAQIDHVKARVLALEQQLSLDVADDRELVGKVYTSDKKRA